MYLIDLFFPRLIERVKVWYALMFLFRLFTFSAFYRVELFFLFLRLTSAENVEHILALIEKPCLTL